MAQIVEIENAEEFIDYLRPHSGHWRPADTRDAGLTIPTGWIYRGKRDASWTLLPKALRPGNLEPYTRDWICCEEDSGLENRKLYLAQHILSELRAVEWFLELADEVGIPNPIRYSLRREIGELKPLYLKMIETCGRGDEKDVVRPLPGLSMVEAFAVAQHHGIPTRLLDWTARPLVAAFFAARGAWRPHPSAEPGDRIAVWAINIRKLPIDPGESRVRSIIAYGGQNDYLRSQGGMFLYDVEANRRFLEAGRWPTIDEAISEQWRGPAEEIPFVKVTAPANVARDILRILFHERITPAHLMPTLDNVAETVLYYQRLFERTNGLGPDDGERE